MEEAFPGMGPDGVAEKSVVGAAFEAVGAAVLDVGPAGREIVDGLDVVIDDRGVAEPVTNLIPSVEPAKLFGRILVGERCFGNRDLQASTQWLPPIARLPLQ